MAYRELLENARGVGGQAPRRTARSCALFRRVSSRKEASAAALACTSGSTASAMNASSASGSSSSACAGFRVLKRGEDEDQGYGQVQGRVSIQMRVRV